MERVPMPRPQIITVLSLILLGGLALSLVGMSSAVGQGPSGVEAVGKGPGPAKAVFDAFATGQRSPKLQLTPAVTGLSAPVTVTQAGDGSDRLFVVERGGRIRIVKNGSLLTVPFLDISAMVTTAGPEQSLLGLAFHPSYSSTGLFYVDYTEATGDTVIERFTVDPLDPDLADSGTGHILLTIAQPYANHNGGALALGPLDGDLYIAMGDGGGGGDPGGNGQDLTSLLGKILRIDVDHTDPGLAYAIPSDNPFQGNTQGYREEIWDYGLRNPWRISFDRDTNDLFIGDVGQDKWEEVDIEPAGSGGGVSYGWNIMEGSHCYNPAVGCDPTGLTLPTTEYAHLSDSNLPPDTPCSGSIIGGYVYRGSQHPSWVGDYFFGDYCTGRVYSLVRDGLGGWKQDLLIDTTQRITSFGEDQDGELYLTTINGGRLMSLDESGLGALNSLYTPVAFDQGGSGGFWSRNTLAGAGVSGEKFSFVIWLHMPDLFGTGWARQVSPDFGDVALSKDYDAQAWVAQSPDACLGAGPPAVGYKWVAWSGTSESWPDAASLLDSTAVLRGGIRTSSPSGEYDSLRFLTGMKYDSDLDGNLDSYLCSGGEGTAVTVR